MILAHRMLNETFEKSALQSVKSARIDVEGHILKNQHCEVCKDRCDGDGQEGLASDFDSEHGEPSLNAPSRHV